jgi:hypothetical protein
MQHLLHHSVACPIVKPGIGGGNHSRVYCKGLFCETLQMYLDLRAKPSWQRYSHSRPRKSLYRSETPGPTLYRYLFDSAYTDF